MDGETHPVPNDPGIAEQTAGRGTSVRRLLTGRGGGGAPAVGPPPTGRADGDGMGSEGWLHRRENAGHSRDGIWRVISASQPRHVQFCQKSFHAWMPSNPDC